MKTITRALIDHHDEMRNLVREIKKDTSKFYLLKKHLDIHHELEEDLLLSKLHVKKEIKDDSLESLETHIRNKKIFVTLKGYLFLKSLSTLIPPINAQL